MALVTTVRDLHRRRGREHRHLALAEGVRLVEEMLHAEVNCKGGVVAPALDATPRGAALKASMRRRGIALEEVSDAEMARLAATEHPQGVIAVYTPRAWSFADLAVVPRHPMVLLDGVQDPGNVGAIARTAFALGAAGLVALPGTADLTNPKTVRGAMGALFRLPHLHAAVAETLHWLDGRGVELWAATGGAGDTSIGAATTPSGASERALAIVFGNEGAGIGDELVARAARRITVPIRAEAESLNVAAAAAIVLFAVTR
jgi:RNA methyltransferase, TrmH family